MSISTFNTITNGLSVAADLCDVYTHAGSNNLTAVGKVALATKTACAALGICSVASKVLDCSLKVQQGMNLSQMVASMIHFPLELCDVAERAGSGEFTLPSFRMMSAIAGSAAQIFRLIVESSAFTEKKYLAMSDEERAKEKRPIYESVGEDSKIVGYRPVVKAECEEVLAFCNTISTITGSIESAGKFILSMKVPEPVFSAYSKLQNFINRFRQAYSQLTEAEGFNLLARQTIPDQFYDDTTLMENICPITGVPIRHPVKEPVTNTIYERAAIETWIDLHHTSPMTRLPLEKQNLILVPEIQAKINNRLQQIQNNLNGLDNSLKGLRRELEKGNTN
jgi:hypothetical protein